MTGPCRGCLLDEDGICHDCAAELRHDPGLTVEDLRWIMPGPE